MTVVTNLLFETHHPLAPPKPAAHKMPLAVLFAGIVFMLYVRVFFYVTVLRAGALSLCEFAGAIGLGETETEYGRQRTVDCTRVWAKFIGRNEV